ncbi:major facilitator superfamily transporter [Colletotrichum graminicola]|uniref:Major facilitator superfamily transporter n=1 Tax=Colletotrichum graminicola (strain M1.001 / M2 / FGSC 10212) TaxID=645133 RepID=E3QVV6_COLGM|nr:major facilitator superfamily transporter [Colletotrichum graminicola M1.001]EFQ34994.1 major facilitator superfamily transporter [Colletotrichum graminicola M1.001]WDK18164.1 major facilitator superfamily transporter [Colletotrichum graminicola]
MLDPTFESIKSPREYFVPKPDTQAILGEIQETEPEWTPGRAEYAAMATISVISLMVALDATVLVPVLPDLALDLGGSATDAFWAGTSYLLPCAVFQPFIGALSDIFGRKEMLLVSLFFFTLGTLLCAPLARDFTALLAGRSLQGVGGGGIITMGQIIFADIVPLRLRPKYFIFVLGAWAIGSVLGPLLGGLFVEHATWRWCFYINFPFCALGFVMVPLFVRLSTEKSSLGSKLLRVDFLGGFLFIGGMTSFLVGLSWAGIQYEWTSIAVIAPISAGAAAVSFCLLWERYGAAEPFLRRSLFYSWSAVAAYLGAFCQGFLLFCGLYYIPFYFLSVRFVTPTQSGLNLFPVTCLLLPGSIIVSVLTSRLGRFRWAIWSGWAITSTGCGLLVLLDENTTTMMWAICLAVFGIGNGMVLTSVNVGTQAISRVEDCGRAACMYAFMRTLGMSVGVAVGGTTFQNVMTNRLQELGMSEAIAKNAEIYATHLAAMDSADPERIGALSAYVTGFRGVFWVMTATAAFGFLSSLIIRKHTMDRTHESKFTLQGAKNRKSEVPSVVSNVIKV